jgi:diadenosine tetraphosphate (Ap4A) HIT family hydrolase
MNGGSVAQARLTCNGGVAIRPSAVLNPGMFVLDPAFSATSHALGELALCEARLQADARFPWIVLIPRVENAEEIEHLSAEDRRMLLDEVLLAGAAVRAVGEALGRPSPKLNIGQLGNITRQLHVHVVGRRPDDAAWPGPVWGAGVAQAYGEAELAVAIQAARASLNL